MRSIETVGEASEGEEGRWRRGSGGAIKRRRLPPSSRRCAPIHFPHRFAAREEKGGLFSVPQAYAVLDRLEALVAA
jgi:hypothetical protein